MEEHLKAACIPVAEPAIGSRELEYVTDAVRSGWVSSQGAYITRFEAAFREVCRARYATTVSSGTTALHLALVALGVGPGDEVIVPTLTFVATANAVLYTGAAPVFVDSEPDTYCLDVESIESCITTRTKAIIAVHLYGHPADMVSLGQLAKRYQLRLIEDAAEAHGSCIDGEPVGALGDVGIFSFYGNKIITTGEGGMLVTNDEEVARRAELLKNHGMGQQKYWHPVIGFNYRMTNLQAALGLAQLERLGHFVARKREIVRLYRQYLGGVKGVRFQAEREWARSAYWMVSVTIDPAEFGLSREELMARLAEQGIETRPFFYPIHLQPPYRQRYGTKQGDYPVAERLSTHGINLPSSVLLIDGDVKSVCEAICRAQP